VAGDAGPMHSTPKGVLCDECFVYWKKSGLMRPELYPSKSTVKKIKRPPKNMALDLDSILAMYAYDNHPTSNIDSSEVIDPVDRLEEEIRQELTVIQNQNQEIGQMTKQAHDGMDSMRIPFLTSSNSPFMINNSNAAAPTATPNWSTEDILLAIQGFAKYGKDFETIARILGPTKAVADVETFFLECRERYQLDMVIEIGPKTNNSTQRRTTGSTTNAASTNELNSNRSSTNDVVFVN
jgi:hypothetical protein